MAYVALLILSTTLVLQELSSQLSEKDETYVKLRSAHDRSLSEVKRLKEQLFKAKDVSDRKHTQLESMFHCVLASALTSSSIHKIGQEFWPGINTHLHCAYPTVLNSLRLDDKQGILKLQVLLNRKAKQ
jgi:hypothetical protein